MIQYAIAQRDRANKHQIIRSLLAVDARSYQSHINYCWREVQQNRAEMMLRPIVEDKLRYLVIATVMSVKVFEPGCFFNHWTTNKSQISHTSCDYCYWWCVWLSTHSWPQWLYSLTSEEEIWKFALGRMNCSFFNHQSMWGIWWWVWIIAATHQERHSRGNGWTSQAGPQQAVAEVPSRSKSCLPVRFCVILTRFGITHQWEPHQIKVAPVFLELSTTAAPHRLRDLRA